jgi:hypothetical protein
MGGAFIEKASELSATVSVMLAVAKELRSISEEIRSKCSGA